jgi:hypothetical protein
VGASSPAPSSYSAPAPAAPASAGGDRWAAVGRSSSPAPASRSAGGATGARLSAGDLSCFKVVDLVEIGAKRGVSGGRNATREGLTDALVKAGVTLDDLSRGQLIDLATKLGKAGLSRDLAAARAELAPLIGGSGSAAPTWRATPAPTSYERSSAAAPASGGGDRWASYSRSSGGSSSGSAAPAPASWRRDSSSAGAASGSDDRWSKYSAGATQSASWRRSGSHNASGSKLSSADLANLRIDDLRDLVSKVGAQLPREPTKDGVISALTSKGVSLNDLTRGEWLGVCVWGGGVPRVQVVGARRGANGCMLPGVAHAALLHCCTAALLHAHSA